MTKAGFLTKLSDALQNIPAADRDAALAFFTEQLDDRIEEGMTEAEAVDALGNFSEIVAALLDEAASAQAAAQTMPAADPQPQDERGQSNRPEPRSFITESRPRTIELTETNCAVEILPSPDASIHIDYDVTRWVSVSITRSDDRLVYTAQEIFHIFHFDFHSRKPTRLYLPGDYLPNLEIRTGNTKLTAADISCDTANLKTSNAALTLTRMTANNLTAKTSNGALTAEQITANALKLTTGNGSLEATHCTADSLNLKTSNAPIRVEHVTVSVLDAVTSNGRNSAEYVTADSVRLVSGNGRVELQNTTANDIVLKTSNAAVVATLPGSIADYRITAKTVNGKNSLPPQKLNGDKSLDVTTSNGKIDVVFAGDR